jgi:hypothetical protein
MYQNQFLLGNKLIKKKEKCDTWSKVPFYVKMGVSRRRFEKEFFLEKIKSSADSIHIWKEFWDRLR